VHASDDDLALLALGEPVPAVEEHVHSCPSCRAELLALASTVDVARRADLADLAPPPARVWDRIAGELQLADPPPVVVPLRSGPARRTPWRRALLAGAAGLVAASAVAALVVGLSRDETPEPVRASPLTALGPVAAGGQVVLSGTDDRRALQVETDGLAAPDGFYEVWLVDLADGRVLALGVLDESGRARLTVPEGVDLQDYPEVDVSLERDDGDPSHSGRSVLRGDLPA